MSPSPRTASLTGALGSHLFDLTRWITSLTPTALCCALTRVRSHRSDAVGIGRAVTSDDSARVALRYSDDCSGAIVASMMSCGGHRFRVAITGELGCLEYSNGILRVWKNEDDTRSDEGAVEVVRCEEIAKREFPAGTEAIAKALADALQAKQTSVNGAASMADGIFVQACLDACKKSHQEMCWVCIAED